MSVTARPRVVQVLDGGDDGGVGGRAAVGRAAVDGADEVGVVARQAGDGPGQRRGDLVGGVDAGADLAVGGAQVGAEPADDERDGGDVGQRRLQLVERDGPVGAALAACARSPAMLVAAPTLRETGSCA